MTGRLLVLPRHVMPSIKLQPELQAYRLLLTERLSRKRALRKLTERERLQQFALQPARKWHL